MGTDFFPVKVQGPGSRRLESPSASTELLAMSWALSSADEGERWTFTAEALAGARAQASHRAVRALGGYAPHLLNPAEESLFVRFYAHRLPEVWRLSGVPPEVQWTSLVFYQRIFVVRSPMEFDPMLVMFACIHIACKTEEVHDMSLDRLLESTVGLDEQLKRKVAALELPLLEALRFSLFVEPQPFTALQMLGDELQQCCGGHCSPTAEVPASPRCPEGAIDEIIARAYELVIECCVRTDAVVRWPASVIISAALSISREQRSEQHPEARVVDVGNFSDTVHALLGTNLEGEYHRVALRSMTDAVSGEFHSLLTLSDLSTADVEGIARRVWCCHGRFENLREEASVQHEARRKERKRRWCELKSGGRHVPTPMTTHCFAELARRAADMIAEDSEAHRDLDG